MGLEGVELVMAFEEEFEIEISDSEAESLITIEKTVDFIKARLEEDGLRAVPLEDVEDDVYQLISEALGISSPPDLQSKLKDILPLGSRRKRWRYLQDELGRTIPNLVRPQALVLTIWLVSIVSGMWGITDSVYFALLSFVVTVVMLFFITKPFQTRFPNDLETVGDLAHKLIEKKGSLSRIQRAEISREAVKQEVIRIVVDQLGVQPEQCDDSSRYVEDLGVD